MMFAIVENSKLCNTIIYYVSGYLGHKTGLKWTRTIDLTLIRRAL